MIEVKIRMTKAELAKLEELAKAQTTTKKTYTVQDCIRSFAQTCQPGGSGWMHPASKKKK